MKKVYKRSLTTKLYMIFGLCWIWMSMSSCLFNYYGPSSDVSFSGTTSYCQGATATPNTYTYDQCTSSFGGILDDGVAMNVQWYYNTTGGTSIGTSTPLGGPLAVTSAPGGTGTLNYTPLTSTTGTFYYFAYMSWATTGACSFDYTSGTQTINITPPLASISGTATVCAGSTTTFTASAPGGAWGSSATGIATVTGGVVTGIAPGTALISYALGSCAATRIVTVSAMPTAITPTTPVAFCQGTTTTLASSPAGGAWGSGATGIATVAGGVVTGIAPGTALISYTVGSCTVNKVVTVNQTPTAITPATPLVFCEGTTTTLASTPAGGTWTSSTPATATVDPTTGVVSGVAGGTVTITYTLTGGCTAVKTITVTPTPGAIGGTTSGCIGYTTTLTNTAPGGVWTSTTPTVATVNPATGFLSGLNAGTTVISYTGCTTVTITVTVNDTPAPIAGPSTVCAGGANIVLSDITAGGTWSSSTPGFATVATSGSGLGIVTGIAAGTTTITYSGPGGCNVFKIVTVDPLPAAITGIVPICEGGSMTVTNAVGGGSWSSSVTGVATADPFTGLVTGVTGGTTLISYTNSCGTVTAPATIDALPAPITGRDTVCVGAHTTLADVTIGGTWSSSNPAVASVISGLGSGLITGNAVGTTYISYTMPGGCYVTDLLTSYLMPSAISGTTQMCAGGGSTVLAIAETGGTWSSNNPAAASIGATTGVVIGITADTVGIVYTASSGCKATTLVTVNPLPLPINGNPAFCATLTDTLTDPTPGGTWSSNTPAIATIDATTGIITAISGGVASIRYTLPTGCSITGNFNITPAPSPVVTFNSAINTFYTAEGFSSYQWYNTVNGLIPGATIYRTAATTPSDYYVVVTNEDGCKAESAHYTYTLSMGVNNAPSITAHIYPNPATDMVYIECAVPVNAIINSMDGKLLIEKKNAKELNTAMLTPGVYTLSLSDAQGNVISISKLVKE